MHSVRTACTTLRCTGAITALQLRLEILSWRLMLSLRHAADVEQYLQSCVIHFRAGVVPVHAALGAALLRQREEIQQPKGALWLQQARLREQGSSSKASRSGGGGPSRVAA